MSFPGEKSPRSTPRARRESRPRPVAAAEEPAYAGDAQPTVEPPAAQPVTAESEPVRPRRQPTASEPRLERVVVGPDRAEAAAAGTAEADSEAAKAPTRKGWWQRRFGDG